MKKSTKIWLGILTFIPFFLMLFFMIYFIGFFIDLVINAEQNKNAIPESFLQNFSVMIGVIVFAIILKLSVMVYYIIHLSNNPDKESNTKIIWIALLVLMNTIGSIVYYFTEILPSKKSNQSIASTS
jgi:heme/copper-type cytochrome/quinol oxidase subunit 4